MVIRDHVQHCKSTVNVSLFKGGASLIRSFRIAAALELIEAHDIYSREYIYIYKIQNRYPRERFSVQTLNNQHRPS